MGTITVERDSAPVKETRKKLGMSQVEFSELIGVNQPRVSDFERGFRAETKTHLQLCKALLILHEHGLLEVFKGR